MPDDNNADRLIQSVELPSPADIFGMAVQPIRFDDLHANEWNPNVMDEANWKATHHSLRTFGFIIPVVARERDDRLEIIDGEHRCRIATEIHTLLTDGKYRIREDALYDSERGYLRPNGERLTKNDVCPHPTMFALRDHGFIPVINMGKVAEVIARQLTLVLNHLHGVSQTVRVAELLAWIHQFDSAEYIAQTLARSQSAVNDLIAMASFDWTQYNTQATTTTAQFEPATYKRLKANLTTEEHAMVVAALDRLLVDAGLDPDTPRERALGIALVRLAALHVPPPHD